MATENEEGQETLSPQHLAEIGARIAQLKKVRRINGDELAKAVGVHRNSITRWQDGKVQLKVANLIRLAEALDSSVEYLIGRPGRVVHWLAQPGTRAVMQIDDRVTTLLDIEDVAKILNGGETDDGEQSQND